MKKHRLLALLWLAVIVSLVGACGPGQSGTITVGIVNYSAGIETTIDGFKAGMTEAGYVEGEDIVYYYDGATNTVDALDAAIEIVLAQQPDLILSLTTPATQKIKAVTEGTGIPVVFTPITDPVDAGLVDSLPHPGGNLTGVRTGGSIPKALEWLLAIAPQVQQVYVPHKPDDDSSVKALGLLSQTASDMGVELLVAETTTAETFDAALGAIPQEADAIFMLPSGFFSARTAGFVAASVQARIPVMSVAPKYKDGVQFSYGHDYQQIGKQAARLADQILRGTEPANLPVETSEFYLGINLPAVEAIGLEIADDVLRQADDIVR